MRRLLARPPRSIPTPAARRYATSSSPHSALIRIDNATFYRDHPDAHHDHDSASNLPLYPGLDFTLPAKSSPNEHWAVLSSSSANRTAFLQILRGQYLCIPPTARSYPYLHSREVEKKNARLRSPSHAIQYVGFDAERGGLQGASTKGAYMSARYESMREATDWNLLDYLMGKTELNADESMAAQIPMSRALDVMRDLNLTELRHMPVSHLSNGQTRRARIAKALLAQPELLLLDGTFMGLDPVTLLSLSKLLHRLAEEQNPRLLLSLRPQDHIPDWITHFVVVGSEPKASVMGNRHEVFEFLRDHYVKTDATQFEFRTAYFQLLNREQTELMTDNLSKENCVDVVDRTSTDEMLALYDIARKLQAKGDFDQLASHPQQAARLRFLLRRPKPIYEEQITRDGIPYTDVAAQEIPLGDPVIEMKGVQIRYADSDTPVLGDWEGGLSWEVRRGQRWGVFGPNGSGKTTLLSLITSDHPQTYSAPVKLFGRSRLPEPGTPGVSIFEIQSRMGHSSPEVHTYFPKHLTVRRVLESAWADTPLTKPRLDFEADQKVEACLRWFRGELNPEVGDTLDQRGEAYCYSRKSKASERTPLFAEATATTLRDEEHLLQPGLDWADTLRFRDLTFSAQRVALFLRAIIKAPDLIVLDEAFSGMDEFARDKCLLFLHYGESMTLRHVFREKPHLRPNGAHPHPSTLSDIGRVRVSGLSASQALVVVSHQRDEVPNCVRDYLTLPEPGSGNPPRIGRLAGPPGADWRRWGEIWGVGLLMGRKKHEPGSAEDCKQTAVLGHGSPVEVYSKSLNILTDTVGLPTRAEAAKNRWAKEAEETEEVAKEAEEAEEVAKEAEEVAKEGEAGVSEAEGEGEAKKKRVRKSKDADEGEKKKPGRSKKVVEPSEGEGEVKKRRGRKPKSEAEKSEGRAR